jgi:hypothetical protein
MLRAALLGSRVMAAPGSGTAQPVADWAGLVDECGPSLVEQPSTRDRVCWWGFRCAASDLAVDRV